MCLFFLRFCAYALPVAPYMHTHVTHTYCMHTKQGETTLTRNVSWEERMGLPNSAGDSTKTAANEVDESKGVRVRVWVWVWVCVCVCT